MRCIKFLVLILFFGLVAIGSVPNGFAKESFTISERKVAIRGQIVIADSDKLPTELVISINRIEAKVDLHGRYNVRLTEADVYQIRITGIGVFEMVQTFAHIELISETRPQLNIPMIEVVAKRPGRVELIFGGDVMMGRRYLKPRWNEPQLVRDDNRAADMEGLTGAIKPYFQPPDYAAINLETILAENEPLEHAPKSVVFYTHPQILEALKSLGVDYVSLGNNHTYDYLDQGLDATLVALRSSGLGFSGAGIDEQSALAPFRASIKGQDYAMFGYVGWKGRVTPNQVAREKKGGAALGSINTITKAVAKESAAGRVTVVQYHGSREYSEGPTEITEERLKSAVDAGADLVVGHHPHVTHGLELYNGKLIAYSLGNFLFDQFFYETHAAYALKVWMDGEDFYRAEVIPIHVKGYRPQPAMADLRRHILQRVFAFSAERGTYLRMSGGHGLITKDSGNTALDKHLDGHAETSGHGIRKLGFRLGQITPVSSGKQKTPEVKALRYGRDLLFRGGFESYGLMGVDERTWETQNGKLKLQRESRNGRFSLKLINKNPDTPSTLSLKTFLRVLDQDEYSFVGWIKAKLGSRISGFVQYRPKGMNRYRALVEADFDLIGTQKMDSPSWQQFKFDFKAKRAVNQSALPMRVMLRFEPIDGDLDTSEILIDDLAIIGWETSDQRMDKSTQGRRTHIDQD